MIVDSSKAPVCPRQNPLVLLPRIRNPIMRFVFASFFVAFVGCKDNTESSSPSLKRVNNPDPILNASVPLYKVDHEVAEFNIDVKIGDKFIIQETSLTGWEWSSLKDDQVPACLKLESKKPVPPLNPDPNAVGGGSTTQYHFIAQSACLGKIVFKVNGYGKPYQVTFHVSVKSA